MICMWQKSGLLIFVHLRTAREDIRRSTDYEYAYPRHLTPLLYYTSTQITNKFFKVWSPLSEIWHCPGTWVFHARKCSKNIVLPFINDIIFSAIGYVTKVMLSHIPTLLHLDLLRNGKFAFHQWHNFQCNRVCDKSDAISHTYTTSSRLAQEWQILSVCAFQNFPLLKRVNIFMVSVDRRDLKERFYTTQVLDYCSK